MRKCNAELYHNLVRMQLRKHAALIDRAASIHNPLACSGSHEIVRLEYEKLGSSRRLDFSAAIPRRSWSRAHPFEHII